MLGERAVDLPLAIKLTHGGGYAFVSIPKMVGVFKLTEVNKKPMLVLQEDLADGKAAAAALTPLLPASVSTKLPLPELDPELTAALTKIPEGFKLIAVTTENGMEARLVRQRPKVAEEGSEPAAKKELVGAGKGKK